MGKLISQERSFIYEVVRIYWNSVAPFPGKRKQRLRSLFKSIDKLPQLPSTKRALANQLTEELSKLSVIDAAYHIGEIYSQRLPKEYRSRYGIYFTPPALAYRLIDNAEAAGINLATARVIDPACGGGAFLFPIAHRIKKKLSAAGKTPGEIIDHIATHLFGNEIDPFSAWLSQVFVDITLLDEAYQSTKRLPLLVTVSDTLAERPAQGAYDLVIGNPPYSKIKLSEEMREQYARSLYGHANLYGLFTDQGLSLLKEDGVLAYVTPTSFLSGRYFKSLRKLLTEETYPVNIDFIETRNGVFKGVLQETLLATFVKNNKPQHLATSHAMHVGSQEGIKIIINGTFHIDTNSSDPWFIPRSAENAGLLASAAVMPNRLADYGYKVSTGPLVWNRHKDQILSRSGKHRFPLIWSESVQSDGTFIFKSEKKNHAPWFKHLGPKDDWLLVTTPCLLLQRTTAKEQRRRLIAAQLPTKLIDDYGAVVVENHLNMILPKGKQAPKVSFATLHRIITSKVLDNLFRSLNGSVAVSAYELEAIPLPSVEQAHAIQSAIESGGLDPMIEEMIEETYREPVCAAA